MCVDHRRLNILVAEQLLHRADVVPVFEKMCRERVPERVAGCGFGEPGRPDRV